MLKLMMKLVVTPVVKLVMYLVVELVMYLVVGLVIYLVMMLVRKEVMFVIVVALVGLPLWAFDDGYVRPADAWSAAGYQKRKLLTLVSLGTPVIVGFVTAAVYFGRIRPRILRAAAADAETIQDQYPEAIPEPRTSSSVG